VEEKISMEKQALLTLDAAAARAHLPRQEQFQVMNAFQFLSDFLESIEKEKVDGEG